MNADRLRQFKRKFDVDDEAKIGLRQELKEAGEELDGLKDKKSLTREEVQRVDYLADLTEYASMPTSLPPGLGQPGEQRSHMTSPADFKPRAGYTNYRELFGSNLSDDGFPTFGDFARAVMSGGGDRRLRWLTTDEQGVTRAGSNRAATESPPSAGGFLVPEEFSAALLDAGLEDSIVMPRASVFPMRSATLKIPGLTIGSHSSFLYGNVQCLWEGEGASLTDTPPKTRAIQLNAHKLTAFSTSSNELKADAPDFESRMSGILAKAIGWFADLAFLSAAAGSGAGRPQSFMASPALIVINKETGQTTSPGIIYKNLTKMFARMHPAGINKAVWIASNTTIPALMELSVAIGTGGSFYQVMREANGAFSIFGRPVLFSEKVPALNSAGDISFVDLSQYAIGLRGQLQLAVSPHVLFRTDETAWRAIMRCDGQGVWDEPLTPKNGDSLSPFITLGAR